MENYQQIVCSVKEGYFTLQIKGTKFTIIDREESIKRGRVIPYAIYDINFTDGIINNFGLTQFTEQFACLTTECKTLFDLVSFCERELSIENLYTRQ